MNKGNVGAFPNSDKSTRWDGSLPEGALSGGLTKREFLSGMAMQGLIMRDKIVDTDVAARKAVSFADALLNELSEEDKK